MDLDNRVDPMSIKDKYARVKFEFPFYRTDIRCFQNLLSNITPRDELVVQDMNTSFISIDDFKSAFCVTPAWQKDWPNVEMLLKSHIFKEIARARPEGHSNV